MKQFYFMVAAIFAASGVQSQIINFPDANFKTKLLSATTANHVAEDGNQNSIKIDTNNNGQIEVSEASQVVTLDISGSQITDVTGISGFANLEDLSCGWNDLISLDLSTSSNLKYIDCQQNNISALSVAGVTNLISIVANWNNLSSINLSGLTSLNYLDLTFNQLSAIDLTGLNALENFKCGHNLFTSISFNNLNSLKTISCSYNLINSITIDNLPALTTLLCSSNLLSSSFTISANSPITNLNCTHNQFVNLDVSNLSSLQVLDCSYNDISSLTLPASMFALACKSNQLTELNLPGINLSYLNCIDNLISYLDLSAMTNLIELECAENPISSLNLNNPNLQALYCTQTLVNSLDFSQCPNFTSGTIDNNQLLTMLNFKNGDNIYAQSITYSYNPNLAYICADEGKIAGFQTMITQNGYNCSLNSYCSFVPGGEFYTVEGTAKYDQNADGCGVSDMAVPDFKINLTDGTIFGSVISNESGNYTIPVQTGTHTLSPVLENPSYFTVIPATVNVTFPTQASPFTQDFCIAANGVHNDLEAAILPISTARPGFDATYKIIYKNKGTSAQSGSVNLAFNDALSNLVSAVPAISSQSTNSLSWNFTNLQPFETRSITLTLNLNTPTETPPLNGGDILDYSATVTSALSEETPVDNVSQLHQNVVNSFDPNDKTCLEGNTIGPNMVGEYVHYVIRFENTGTADAVNIVVKDMIDTSKFDVSTLISLHGSHPFTTRISAGNKVEFIFENINLPFDDANNDGYVAFKIKTKPTLVVGDTFSNTASIYFDYNFPIVTNTATTAIEVLGNADFEFSQYFTLYPNPAKNVLNIQAKQTAIIKTINIYNVLGQLVLAIPNADNLSSVDVSDLKSGNYFIKIISDKGSTSAKFIKQ